jgi:hypothetical protein
VNAFAAIPERLLGPLEGKNDDTWHRGRPGIWSPAEIVAHVAVSIALSVDGLDSRRAKPPMRRRRRLPYQLVARTLVLGTGWFPVRRTAPENARPVTRPDRAETEAKLRESVARFERLAAELLPARAHDLFLKHPVFGDLTIDEWRRFHVVHAEHHRKQLIRRIGDQESRQS